MHVAATVMLIFTTTYIEGGCEYVLVFCDPVFMLETVGSTKISFERKSCVIPTALREK